MSRIGLIDVDKTGFPNIALGKVATYHKGLGDEVIAFFGLDSDDVEWYEVEELK